MNSYKITFVMHELEINFGEINFNLKKYICPKHGSLNELPSYGVKDDTTPREPAVKIKKTMLIRTFECETLPQLVLRLRFKKNVSLCMFIFNPFPIDYHVTPSNK